MFKKILQSLSKSQQAKTQAPAASAKPSGPTPVARSAAGAPPPAVQERVLIGTPPKDFPTTSSTPRTPEELCELTPKMSKDQISTRLKLLYRRFNRSASSLDPKVRAEAEKMLNAIVLVREKHFGEL
jgi:hypothetical protein